jgi:hypothetical protein
MCKRGKQKVLGLPANIDTHKEHRTVCVDECIVSVINKLWANNINTLGCCCGHGVRKPSIVISDGYKKKDYKQIYKLIKSVDCREWDIFQWQIVNVLN